MAVLDWGHKIKRKHFFFFFSTLLKASSQSHQCGVLLLAYISLCQHFHTPNQSYKKEEKALQRRSTLKCLLPVAIGQTLAIIYNMALFCICLFSFLLFFSLLVSDPKRWDCQVTVWWWAHSYPVTALSLWMKHTGPSLAPHFLLGFF